MSQESDFLRLFPPLLGRATVLHEVCILLTLGHFNTNVRKRKWSEEEQGAHSCSLSIQPKLRDLRRTFSFASYLNSGCVSGIKGIKKFFPSPSLHPFLSLYSSITSIPSTASSIAHRFPSSLGCHDFTALYLHVLRLWKHLSP